MKREIDARGLKCPKPVILTRKALEEGSDTLEVLVDNEAARDNVRRFAEKAGCSVSVKEMEGYYSIEIKGAGAKLQKEDETISMTYTCSIEEKKKDDSLKKVIFIKSDEIGTGDRELGTTLAKSFLYACTESDEIPTTLIFMNSGVRLVTENDETASHVKNLERKGCEVLVCGTCLDFYGLKDSLLAGRVSNMYEILSTLIGADLVVSI